MLTTIPPQRLLDVFGITGVVYFAIPQESGLRQETAGFLSFTGLPTSKWFTPEDDLEERESISRTSGLLEYFEDEGSEAPAGCESWEILGRLLHWTIFIDPESGKVYEIPEGDDVITEIHADVTSLVHALIVLQEGEREFKGISDPDYTVHADIVERMKSEILRIDETPFSGAESCWNRLFEEISLGMWG
ncbi:SUKH-4 family immunity protein [Streptomyces zhihengii]|uniref:SUKH-4 family immunity protein n=1 Tax=Streptomyces zhihengii TaxID=1818004 RepID=A0ABS2V2V0_9ACTN|nr:SUKH-4 family immunity protein [Streptomyces zhihengii]MBM9623792.1 SUKH-4 family immunity protein [Streptomyces zhihengii]